MSQNFLGRGGRGGGRQTEVSAPDAKNPRYASAPGMFEFDLLDIGRFEIFEALYVF